MEKPKDAPAAPARPASQAGDWPDFPPGPALLYVHSDQGMLSGTADTHTITRVDQGGMPTAGGVTSAAEARRERRLLRALLEHTLAELDRAGA